MVTVKRLTMFQPSAEKVENREQVSRSDYKWQLIDLAGERHDLGDFEGKVLFINRWATWCPPCIAEMPSIQQLYDRYRGNDQVAFLMVSNEEPDVVRGFMEKGGYDFPVYIGQSRSPMKLQSNVLPTTFIISKEGEIVLEKKGSAKWHGDKVTGIIDGLLSE